MIESSIHTPNRSWFLVTAAVACAAILGFSIFFLIQKSSLKSELAQLEKQRADLLKSENVQEKTKLRALAVDTLQKLAALEKNQIVWSSVIEKIEKTVPQRGETEAPIVTLRSYTASESGKILASGTTLPDALDPFDDISKTIAAFAGEPSFQRVFVPSISKSITPSGALVLSFSVTFEYQKQTF